jgi:hypothetical protein
LPKLIDLVQVNRLLEQLAAIEEKLTPNERELFHTLKTKYRDPGASGFDDKTCLEVMLRNVEIRRGYALDPQDTVGRIIDLPRTGDAEDA